MLPKALSDISLQDVQTLCDNRVTDNRFIDFKAEAIGRKEGERREFLADVCAFANASGGDLVLGVKEEDGTAKEPCGIDVANPDEEKQFLVNLVRDGLEPRYSGLDTKWLPMSGTRGVMIVRIPHSWSAPHRVTYLKDMRFYVRNSVGKHPMSVDELREAFTFSASFAERMRAFRDERVHTIETHQLPFEVFSGPKIALLIVPWSAMLEPLDLDIQDRKIDGTIYPLPGVSGWNRQFCLEGVAMIPSGNPVSAYAMVFRTGVVEFVSPILGPSADWTWIQRIVFEGWKQFVAFAKSFHVEPPFSVFATMIEVNGLNFLSDPSFPRPRPPIRQSIVRLPEELVSLDDFEKPQEVLFKRVLNVAANAFGLERWPSYDANGNYRRHR
jgi:Putative DNA-binding domain